jgi:hypothetical protein
MEEIQQEVAASRRELVKAITAEKEPDIETMAHRYLEAVVRHREAVRFAAMMSGGKRRASAAQTESVRRAS